MEENLYQNLKNKITFGDYKLADIPNTCASAIKAVKRFKIKLYYYSYKFRFKSN